MIIHPIQIRRDLGFKTSWFPLRFGHLVKEYLRYNNSCYDIDECIAFAEKYQSNTRNPKQKAKSEQMMKECLEYLKKYRESNQDVC